MRNIITAVTALLMLGACSSINCPLNNTVYSTYMFYKASGDRDTVAEYMTIWTARSDGSDSVLINLDAEVDSFVLPMSYVHETDLLYFAFTDSVGTRIDTVEIRKKDWPHFESPDCSATFFHEILGVEHSRNAIDSIVINNKNVNFDATKANFRIYYRARS